MLRGFFIFMRIFIFCLLLLCFSLAKSQELFPYTEPASNMPARSASLKITSMVEKGVHSSRLLQRHTPEVMLGLNKNWMVHGALSFSDMHQSQFLFESLRFYGKYRFLSIDEVHKHFRMAAFGTASYSRNHLDHNELNLLGDQSGVQVGVIATQLWNKLAVSGTASWLEVLDKDRWGKELQEDYAFSALNYSLSAGYLVLPVEYRDYNQTNLNVYAELLGAKNIESPDGQFYIDLAPSLQFIFNSTGKINLGYRFQLAGDVYRLSNKSFMVSYEHVLLNALQKKKRK